MIDGNKLIEAIQQLMKDGSQPPVQNGRKGKTRVAVVLDSSGSMSNIRNDIIGAYNTNNESIRDGAKQSGTETFVTLVVFGEHGDPVVTKFENQPVDRLLDLTWETYVPQSGTPMYDGIGQAITSLERAATNDPDEAFLVNIFTDGQENASRIWSGIRLSQKIKSLQESGKWTFTVAGANIDLKALAGTLNIPIHNTVQFVPDSFGTQVLSHQHQHGNARYFAARGQGMTKSNAFYGGDAHQHVNPQDFQTTAPPVNQNVQDLIKILSDAGKMDEAQLPPTPAKRQRPRNARHAKELAKSGK